MGKFLLFVMVFSLTGCAIFGEYRQRHVQSTSLVAYLYPQGKVPETDKQRPVLNLPLRVGLAFIPEKSNKVAISVTLKQRLLDRVKNAFSSKPYVNEIIVIPELYLQSSGGYSALEQVNNLYQLDVIALVSYDQIVNGRDNLLSLSYLTIVGAYFLPGSGYDVSTMIDLAVIDIPSRSLLFRSAGTSILDKNLVPGAYMNQAYRKKQNKGFEIAMEKMQGNLFLELTKFEERLKQHKADDRIQVNHRKGYSGGAFSWPIILLLMSMVMLKGASIKRSTLKRLWQKLI